MPRWWSELPTALRKIELIWLRLCLREGHLPSPFQKKISKFFLNVSRCWWRRPSSEKQSPKTHWFRGNSAYDLELRPTQTRIHSLILISSAKFIHFFFLIWASGYCFPFGRSSLRMCNDNNITRHSWKKLWIRQNRKLGWILFTGRRIKK